MFRYQPPLPLDQQRRAERALALARLFIAVAAFVAGSLSQTSSLSGHPQLSYALIAAYVAFAIAAWF